MPRIFFIQPAGNAMELQTILNRPPIVLIADDNKDIREMLQAHLEISGCRAILAGNGHEALEILDREPIDLALLDISMPGKDGLEVCRAMREEKRTRLVPVMIVTAHDSERLQAIEAGADEFLSKPVDSVLLLARARSLLRLRRLHLDLQERNELLAGTLHRYVSPGVAETILAEPDRYLRLGGESRRVTVLFADIKGFVRFTESHTSAEVVAILNRIFPLLTSVIFEHGGTFDKFIGDAVNIAQRLQEEAWPGQVLLSQATYEAAGRPPAHSLGDRHLSGRSGRVAVFSLDLEDKSIPAPD